MYCEGVRVRVFFELNWLEFVVCFVWKYDIVFKMLWFKDWGIMEEMVGYFLKLVLRYVC